ncbi:MAG: hypothetical protein HOP27_01390 [Anaerolineales bacterium]|nr:hypothetical protein [Anaerolineales bacterium]
MKTFRHPLARGFLLSNDWFGCIVGESTGDDFAYRTLYVKCFLASFFLLPSIVHARTSNAIRWAFGSGITIKMIMFSSFGFALRHKIEFNPKTKQGSLLLWSRYDGFFAPQNPLVDGYGSSSNELFILFGKATINYQANFPIGGINDLLSILSAIASTRCGKEFSFLNYEDRIISLQPTKEGKQQVDVVTVKIRYRYGQTRCI